MIKKICIKELQPEQLDSVSGEDGRLGVYKPGLKYKKESLDFFRQCVGDETYRRAMNNEIGRVHHYAAARAFLSQRDWEKFVWIEEYGSLAGFPEG